MALIELFCPYEPIKSLEALLGDFGDFDFGPEIEFSGDTVLILNFFNTKFF